MIIKIISLTIIRKYKNAEAFGRSIIITMQFISIVIKFRQKEEKKTKACVLCIIE